MNNVSVTVADDTATAPPTRRHPPGPQDDLLIDDEDLLEELAPLKDALERAVHRKNQVEQLKDQLEEEVRASQPAR